MDPAFEELAQYMDELGPDFMNNMTPERIEKFERLRKAVVDVKFEPTPEPEQEFLPADNRVKAIRTALEGQHAIHGIFGSVFERLGGENFLYDWAEDNPGRFITLLTKMTPGLQPTQGFQGDLKLTVHPALTTTGLDDM